MSEELFLSVIIPAYNEEKRLGDTLDKIQEYLGGKQWTWEVIVVDDGSKDGTVDLVEDREESFPGLRLVKNATNRGKGFSVRNGMMRGKGKYLLFTDSDLSTPIGDLDKLIERLEQGDCDIAIGSRALPESNITVPQPGHRVFMGRVFNGLVRVLFGTDIRDTQCGFKVFRREAAEAIFPKQSVWRFGFDVEILFIGERLGFQVCEVPVTWENSEDSRVSALKDSLSMFLDLIRIRRRISAIPRETRGHKE